VPAPRLDALGRGVVNVSSDLTGLCACGCGQPTRISPKTCAALGWIKGQPRRYVQAHFKKKPSTAAVKRCRACGVDKPIKEFHRKLKGHVAVCKDCRRGINHDYHAKNADRQRTKGAEWHKANRGSELARMREYRITRRDELRVKQSARHRERPEYGKNAYAVRKLRKGAVKEPLPRGAWRAIQDSYSGLCAYCGKRPEKLTPDHIVPLSGGGAHAVDNLAPACGSCNARKGAKPLLLWLVDAA
jgi:5-methylcytosine-specific restriction endonuclease McrA